MHKYEMFLRQKGIRHILCRVNHPQTNGKLEKFYDLYNNHRFGSLEEFVAWYNDRPQWYSYFGYLGRLIWRLLAGCGLR
jgi:transposase InsO family protein